MIPYQTITLRKGLKSPSCHSGISLIPTAYLLFMIQVFETLPQN